MNRRATVLGSIFLGLLAVWTVFAQPESSTARLLGASNQDANYSVRTLSLPDNNTGDVSMDYIAYDPGTNSIWVPGGNTGAVDVVDAASDKVRQIPDFPTSEVEIRGAKRVLGPTPSASEKALSTSATAETRLSVPSTLALWRAAPAATSTPCPMALPMSQRTRKSG
jgi:hypothetical protein